MVNYSQGDDKVKHVTMHLLSMLENTYPPPCPDAIVGNEAEAVPCPIPSSLLTPTPFLCPLVDWDALLGCPPLLLLLPVDFPPPSRTLLLLSLLWSTWLLPPMDRVSLLCSWLLLSTTLARMPTSHQRCCRRCRWLHCRCQRCEAACCTYQRTSSLPQPLACPTLPSTRQSLPCWPRRTTTTIFPLCHWPPMMVAGHCQIPTACGGRTAQSGHNLLRVPAAVVAAVVQQWVCEKSLWVAVVVLTYYL